MYSVLNVYRLPNTNRNSHYLASALIVLLYMHVGRSYPHSGGGWSAQSPSSYRRGIAAEGASSFEIFADINATAKIDGTGISVNNKTRMVKGLNAGD